MTQFYWYSPTHGDSAFIANDKPEFPFSADYLSANALLAESTGFDGILVPVGPTCADAFVAATYIAALTSKLRLLVAVRPGTFLPTSVAKMAATLDQLSSGRLDLNVIAGGSPLELAMDGDFQHHSERYARAGEFIAVMRKCWEADQFSHNGDYFRVEKAKFLPHPQKLDGIPLFIPGMSETAIDLASGEASVYLTWGLPVDEMQKSIEIVRNALKNKGSGRKVSFGMRINLICAETDNEAWTKAELIISKVSDQVRSKVSAYLENSDSHGQAKITSLRGVQTSDPAYWTGMVGLRSGNSTALVGSFSTVCKSIKSYQDAGVSTFIFSSFPHRDTVEDIGRHVVSRIKKDMVYAS